MDEFHKVSGLKLNINKSIGFGIGSTKEVQGNPGNIIWKEKEENTKILGIFFNSITEASDIEENWLAKLDKIKELSIKLQRRNVSLWGRVLLCKTFLLSQIAYNIQALSMPHKYIVELESICFKFIWHKQNSKKKVIEKIKRQVMCLEKEKGGAGMIKGGTQQKLFLIKWILKVGEQNFNSVFSYTKIPDLYFAWYGGIEYFLTFSGTLSQIPIPELLTRFWKDSIKSWLTLKHNIDIIREKRDFSKFRDNFGILPRNEIPIFLNNKICISNDILFNRRWINCDLKYLHQMLDDSGDFIDFNELPDNIRSQPDSIFVYNSVKSGLGSINRSHEHPFMFLRKDHLLVERFLKIKNNDLRFLMEYDQSLEIYGKNFWATKLNSDIFSRYLCSMNSVKETKIQVTLFKLFHNILPSKILLKKWNMVDSDLCDCGEKDFIDHSFALCELTQPLWTEIRQLILISTGTLVELSTEIKLFGLNAQDKFNLKLNSKSLFIINNILALAKFCMNKARAQKSDLRLCFEAEFGFRKHKILQYNEDTVTNTDI